MHALLGLDYFRDAAISFYSYMGMAEAALIGLDCVASGATANSF